jgi:hypothetical protein
LWLCAISLTGNSHQCEGNVFIRGTALRREEPMCRDASAARYGLQRAVPYWHSRGDAERQISTTNAANEHARSWEDERLLAD